MTAVRAFLALICMTTALSLPVQAQDTPTSTAAAQVINSFVETGIRDVLNADVEPTTRLTRWHDLFVTFFDIPTISRFVVGRHWRRASDDQKSEFIDTFQKYIVYTWYRRFDEYNGQTLRVANTTPDGENGYLVESFIQAPGSTREFAVNWRLREREDGYKIVDVIVEGVSMALTYRSEYASVIKRAGTGVGGLTEELGSEVTALSQEFGTI